jgi:hypothetical protein
VYVRVAQYLGGDLAGALKLNQVWFSRVVNAMNAEAEARSVLAERQAPK